MKLKTVFMGTPEFSVPALAALHAHPGIEIVAVVSQPDRPAGRGQQLASPAVAQYAKAHSLPLVQTENINKTDFVAKHPDVDLVVVLAFAQFLGKAILELPRLGCFNIHTSLLPKYRGAAPIQYALLNGDQVTGVTVQKMVRQMDAGDIVYGHEVQIDRDENAQTLHDKLMHEAAKSIPALVDGLLSGSLVATAQDHSLATFAPVISKDAGWIKFSEQSSNEILNRFKAFFPWPGLYCFLGAEKKRLKVLELAPYTTGSKLKPGEVDLSMGLLVVGSTDGALRLSKVQLEGKKACSDMELINGLREKIATLG